jgi:putative membrane protein
MASYVLFWSVMAISPVDRGDWFLENLLAVSTVVLLLATYRLFQFSTVSYVLITAFLTLHGIGAHYTYAEVPFGFWLQHALELSRNPFDRLVHFGYGFFLVYPLRELFIRLAGLQGFWSYYLPVSGILAQSGLFELTEAVVAQTVSPELGTAYLGTQGDEWDAQKDMMAALTGAVMMASLIWLIERRGTFSGKQNHGPTAASAMISAAGSSMLLIAT